MSKLRDNPLSKKLKPKIINQVEDLFRTINYSKFFEILAYSSYTCALIAIFIIYKKTNFSTLLSFTALAFIALIVVYIDKIAEPPKDRMKKACEKFSKQLVLDICTCPHKCNCKDNLVNFIKKEKKVDLLKYL